MSELRTAFRLTSVLVFLLGVIGAVAACRGPHQSNWRTPPSSPTPCASDADCAGSSCVIELGATQGTCAPAPGMAPGRGGDGGTQGPHSPHGPHPGLDVKPSPSDIQI